MTLLLRATYPAYRSITRLLFSLNVSETEDQDEFDADSDEGGQERKKKWTRSKDKSLADAPLTGDKEVG